MKEGLMNTTITSSVTQFLENSIAAVREIDTDCKTLLNDIEHGLVNVKLEFRDQAIAELRKRLTEEQLIAWLMTSKLRGQGYSLEWEVPYPHDRRKKCDLVVALSNETRLWLELKLAWKAWFNCKGGPALFNPFYQSYLSGEHRTHSFAHDLKKLAGAKLPDADSRVVMLIGFCTAKSPVSMDASAIVRDFEYENVHWELAASSHWPDRRAQDFQIEVCCWMLHSKT